MSSKKAKDSHSKSPSRKKSTGKISQKPHSRKHHGHHGHHGARPTSNKTIKTTKTNSATNSGGKAKKKHSKTPSQDRIDHHHHHPHYQQLKQPQQHHHHHSGDKSKKTLLKKTPDQKKHSAKKASRLRTKSGSWSFSQSGPMYRTTSSKCKSNMSTQSKGNKQPRSPQRATSLANTSTIPIPRTASISSLASSYNLSIGCYTATNKQKVSSKKSDPQSANKEYVNKYGQRLYDCVVNYIYCPTHQKFALTEVFERGLFLPFGNIKIGESWIMASLRSVQQFFLGLTKPHEKAIFQDPKMLDILRIQVPNYFDYIVRVTYCIQLTHEGCHSLNLCKDNSKVTWCSPDEPIANLLAGNYLGPEPTLFQPKSSMNCREISIMDVLFYLYHPDKNNHITKLLIDAGYQENDVLKLYSDFIQHCYPSEFMTRHSFKSFLKKWQLPLHQHGDQVFQAFVAKGNYYLNFSEFLCGLAKIDRSMQQRLPAGNKPKSKSPNKQDLHCEPPPHVHLRTHQCYPEIHLTQVSVDKTAIQAKIQKAKEYCRNCASKKYTLSVHMVKMSIEGFIYEPVVNKQPDVKRMPKHKHLLSEYYFTKSFACNQIIDSIRSFAIAHGIARPLYNKKSRSSSYPRIDRNAFWGQKYASKDFVQKLIKILLQAQNMFKNSERVIKITAPCYVIGDIHGNLHDLLVYEGIIWKLGPYFQPGNLLFLGDYVDRGDYAVECVFYLMCMKILAPDRVFMLRGNHESRAIQMEYTFHNECVDKFGKERGHEIWEKINDVFDVLPLCAIIDESIFCAHGGIPSCAKKVEEIMSVASPLQDPDNDPIASEILWNDPITNQEYDELIKLIQSGANIDNSNTAIIDSKGSKVLKSNSTTGKKKSPSCSETPKSSSVTDLSTYSSTLSFNGFLPNTKRGTACYYSEEALNSFLNINNLTHVIRAHEVIPSGFQYHMGGRCITIFSCSNYCGENNEAAVALVHDSKIRVIKIDTTFPK